MLTFNYFQWQANLRILDVKEIKSVPYNPRTHPFVERLIGSVRREFLDQLLFLNAYDLENKLKQYQSYFNHARCHCAISGNTSLQKSNDKSKNILDFMACRWEKSCCGLFHLPVAA